MPKHKQTNGGTAVLEEKALSVREALARACELEDLADSLARIPGTRKAVARLRAMAEDLEDIADVVAVRKARKEKGSIPWEEVKRKAGL